MFSLLVWYVHIKLHEEFSEITNETNRKLKTNIDLREILENTFKHYKMICSSNVISVIFLINQIRYWEFHEKGTSATCVH